VPQETSLFGLTGKKALIVGGGQGMGEASAKFLARAGCDVALVDLVPERADNVARLVEGIGTKAATVIGDVLDDAQIPRIVAEAESKLGGLDRVITIVGAATFGSLMDTTAEIWDRQMHLNLRYFFLIAKEAANVMIRRGTGGRIVGIASVDGQRAAPMRGAYGAAKAGLISTIRTMAVE
jgi:NAD(P)-dependent dehydrogenase (short-subunit alcohol dehydrogenase family)